MPCRPSLSKAALIARHRLGVGIAALGLLSACTTEVPVVPAEPSSSAAAGACADLVAALPPTLSGEERRATDPASPSTAAWGDPVITLRCGVARPVQLTPTSELVEVNGVEWLPVELTEGYRFVTVGRVTYVELDVPNAYAPEVNALVDLAAPVAEEVPLSEGPGVEPSPS
ncbi:MAG TPA: DUF3515 domain-containing protein [Candidatus Limnocylindria bacterium]|nr:DUF3515 domain-containing protein [Candidatus Limnocylindria bacterium]